MIIQQTNENWVLNTESVLLNCKAERNAPNKRALDTFWVNTYLVKMLQRFIELSIDRCCNFVNTTILSFELIIVQFESNGKVYVLVIIIFLTRPSSGGTNNVQGTVTDNIIYF